MRARLFVPLSVDFATDDKILAARPMAAYLFVCSLAFSKRTLSDGYITRKQLAVVAPGFAATGARRHAETLVAVGLWVVDGDGWRIKAWPKWNRSSAAIESESAA